MAEDLAQEAIVRAVGSEQEFADRIDLRKWMFRVAHNLWIDSLRKSSASTNQGLTLGELVDGARDSPDRAAEITEQMEQVFAQMQRLPAKQRQVLHLRVLEGLTVDEVADTLEMTRGAVKTNLSLARRRLREALAERDDVPMARIDHD